MSLSKADAAAALGVPEREVLEVEKAEAGQRVTTIDGVAYHVAKDGQVSYLANYPKDTFFPVHPSAAAVSAAAEEEGPAASDDQGGEVPDGPVGTVLAWVNRDMARAARALKVERAREQPRTSLVEQLERLANP
jgi:hypothetical protein